MNSPVNPLDLSLSLCQQGLMDDGEKVLRASCDPNDFRVRFNLGWHAMRHGDMKAGFEGLDAGRMINAFGSIRLPGKLWRDEPLEGKTVLFHSECGAGDELINIRFVENFRAKGANVIATTMHGMEPLLARNGILCVKETNVTWDIVHYDYWVPGMSAAYLLGLDYETLSGKPYLKRIPSTLLPETGRKRVGIRWGGLATHADIEPYRKLPWSLVRGLVESHPDFDWYSFQRDNDLHLDFPGRDLSGHMTSWIATSELLAGMDLLITSCTSVAHLAAAMGVEVWLLTPILPYYTWAVPGEKSAWYDAVTLFRQVTPGSWDEPFNQIRERLEAL
jgi:hypothetical protein